MDTSDSRCFRCRQCLSCSFFTCFGERLEPSRQSCGVRVYSISTCSCRCKEEVTCTCKCNVGKAHDVLQKLASIAGGAVLVVGGAALAVGSGGTAFPILGGMVGGAGLSSTIHGAVKTGKGEKIRASEYFVDVGVGALTGVVGSGGAIVTEAAAQDLAAMAAKEACKEGRKKLVAEAYKKGGIKLVEEVYKKGGTKLAEEAYKQGGARLVEGGTKFAVRTVGGMATSVVSTGVGEAGNCFKGKKDWDDYGKDDAMWAKGAAMGALAGMGSHAWSEVKESAFVQDMLKNQDGRHNGPDNPDPYLSDQSRKICSELVLPTAKGAYGIHKGLSETDERFEYRPITGRHFQTPQYPHHGAWNFENRPIMVSHRQTPPYPQHATWNYENRPIIGSHPKTPQYPQHAAWNFENRPIMGSHLQTPPYPRHAAWNSQWSTMPRYW